jgi:hypothetical protein
MSMRDVLLKELDGLSEQDTALLVAVARRLRAKPLGPGAVPEPIVSTRPNTAPLAGTAEILGDIVEPTGEPWEADS